MNTEMMELMMAIQSQQEQLRLAVNRLKWIEKQSEKIQEKMWDLGLTTNER